MVEGNGVGEEGVEEDGLGGADGGGGECSQGSEGTEGGQGGEGGVGRRERQGRRGRQTDGDTAPLCVGRGGRKKRPEVPWTTPAS